MGLEQPAVQPCSLPFTAISGIKVPLNEDSTELQIFQQFVADDILNAITRETNMYYIHYSKPTSSMRPNTSFYDTTSEELKVFLATSIMMGVVRKPDLHLCWSKNGMLETPFFRKTIPRDRYVNIMSNVHFNSNTLDNESDRLFKIRPILNNFTENFCTSYCPDQHISVDESLLKFYGRLKFKQYNPFKRSHFGLKLYRLCESSGKMCGYTWNFKVCSGQDKDKNIPASTKVVMELSKELLGLGNTIYLDNWYSSPNLYYTLLHQQKYAVGTVRLSRKNMPKRFPGRKLKKNEYTSQNANRIMALIWRDKKEVKMLSTKHTSEMVVTGKRDREGNLITKPACVVAYNKGMGGVDRSDQISATCRSVRKHTKWYKKLFFYIIDIAIVNSFLLFKKLHADMRRNTLTEFKVELARQLLQSANIPDYATRGHLRSLPTPDRLRGKNGHFLQYNPTFDDRRLLYKRCFVCMKRGIRK